MEERSGVVDLAPDAVEMRLIAVEEDWRQRGVAKSLVGATEEICRFQGYPWIKTYCTSSYTARLLEKLNWRPVFSLNYLDYITDNGCDIKPPPCPHTHATVYIKALTEDKT
ncbi:hypothetical protein AAG570_012037 [Ranatra chinensis]|uniref:N-acetyltransferase domain-containing protein n=1 Tax=Ranatra chinensis TaxID=642074 RepID=A0ABD0YHN1_9HEMI